VDSAGARLVPARAAEAYVSPSPSVEQVVAGTGVERVASRASEEQVGGAAAEDRVGSGASLHEPASAAGSSRVTHGANVVIPLPRSHDDLQSPDARCNVEVDAIVATRRVDNDARIA
jgi:hypothetical protein